MKHFGLSLQIRNLLNTKYGYPGGTEHLQPVIIQNGREVSFRLNFVF